MLNSVCLIGRLVRDPELRYLPNGGSATCSFTLAVDKNLSKEKKMEIEAKNQPTADFIRIVTWGKLAENVANYTVKGRLVGVQGRIQTGSYEDKDGKRVFTTDVVSNSVEFLEWGDKQQEVPDGFKPADSEDIPF